MELNNNNYTKIMDNKEKASEPKIEKRSVAIHTMPKRYKETIPASKNAKSTGFFILLFGFIFLLLIFVLAYFFVIKKEPVVELDTESAQEQNSDAKSEQEKATEVDEPGKDNSEIIAEEPNEASTTSEKEIKQISTITASTTMGLSNMDGDKDGLSDLEELLLGSSPNSEDSDGDGYDDATELKNLFDPASKERLVDSLNITKFVNEDYKYSFFVSSLWIVEKFSGFETLFISLGKDQFFQIVSQEKSEEQTIDDWYKQAFDLEEISDELKITKGDWRGVRNETVKTVYLEHPNGKYFITINYQLGTDNTLYYNNLFEMLINSIEVEEIEAVTE